MIRRQHDNKQSVKQAIKAVGQMCGIVESNPAPAIRPENGHDIEVSGMS